MSPLLFNILVLVITAVALPVILYIVSEVYIMFFKAIKRRKRQ